MVRYSRWLIVPMVYFDEDVTLAPKYVYGNEKLDRFSSAGPFTREQLADAGYDHLLAHNDAEQWIVVKASGEGTGAWNELNAIHAFNHDTETLADHRQDVKPLLDKRFGKGKWRVK